MRRFNLACQEMRYLLECDGWTWVGLPRQILVEMKKRGVIWATFDGHLPLLVMHKNEQLCLFWLFWQGLHEGEMRIWEQTTRELRQRDLLVGVALTEAVAREIRSRCKQRALRFWTCSIEEFSAPPATLGRLSC